MQSSHTNTIDIQCFKCLNRGHIVSQCPNKKTMVLTSKDEYSSQDESSSESEDSERENSEDACPCKGDLLIIQRTLNNKPSPHS